MARINRRKWAIRAGLGLGAVALGGAYPFLEAKWCGVERRAVAVPRLPRPFEGMTVAFLADVHHGPFVPVSYVRHVVAMANALRPDLILLGGDYTHAGTRYVAPVHAELAGLRAPMGRFAVLGNHDHWDGRDASIAGLRSAGIPLLENGGAWVERRGARLRVAGVADLWTGRPDVGRAVGAEATGGDAVILVSHNPDVAETIDDGRVGLVLSGHTHGGQVVVPGYGAPIVPSRYGRKYVQGLVRAPHCDVFITRGVGTIAPPVRFCCRPEVALLTLHAAPA